MKKFLLIILIFGAGFLVGKWAENHKPPSTGSQLPEIEKKAFRIADNELRNYALAVEAKEKLKAADELYGKIILLFLADLNLHLDLPQEPKETKWPDQPATTIQEQTKTKEGELDPSPFTKFKQTAHEMREQFEKMEKNLAKEKSSGLSKNIEAYKLAKYSSKMTKEIKKMMGEFRGNFKVQSGKYKGKEHSIHLLFDFVMDQNKLDGQSTIEFLNEKGEIYSSSTGEGSNRSILQSKDNPNLIFINCSPDSFLSINLEKYPKLIADYYESDELRGEIILKKINP